jgi:hypothetical protein
LVSVLVDDRARLLEIAFYLRANFFHCRIICQGTHDCLEIGHMLRSVRRALRDVPLGLSKAQVESGMEELGGLGLEVSNNRFQPWW